MHTQKVYVVTEVSGRCETVIALKLTFDAAMAVARLKGNRKVGRWVADKIPTMTRQTAEQHEGEQHGDQRSESSGD